MLYEYWRFVIESWNISILNDVVLNKKLSITDQAALLDAQQSLQQMIYDFLNEQSKKLSESEKRRLASQMNMSPISQEYATELRYTYNI